MFSALRQSLSRARLPAGLRLALAVFYLTLGVSAAWHAPHSSRGALAIGTDRHEHHEAVNSDACALCTVKNAPHQAASAPLPFVGARFAAFEREAPVSRLSRSFAAYRARGPPSFLS